MANPRRRTAALSLSLAAPLLAAPFLLSSCTPGTTECSSLDRTFHLYEPPVGAEMARVYAHMFYCRDTATNRISSAAATFTPQFVGVGSVFLKFHVGSAYQVYGNGTTDIFQAIGSAQFCTPFWQWACGYTDTIRFNIAYTVPVTYGAIGAWADQSNYFERITVS